MPVPIRAARIEDAESIGAMAQDFAGYLRALGDPTPFAFNAETFRRDGFGADPAFAGLVAEVDGGPPATCFTIRATTSIGPCASSSSSISGWRRRRAVPASAAL
jgi:hypothetical protein